MKKAILPYLFLSILILCFSTNYGVAQVVLYENFDYTIPGFIGGNGNAGSTSNNWTTHSVTSGQTTTIDVVAPGLTFTGLVAPAGGKCYSFGSANTTSRDINRAFTTTSTILYYSALINIVDNSQITATGDYFLHLAQTSGTTVTVFGGRLGIKSVNSGANYRFMIQNTSGGTPTFTEFSQDMNFGTTYLVVVKYDRSVSPTSATLWVNPSPLGGSDPTGGVTNTSGTGTFSAFASICIRNNATTPKAEIDEIRVGAAFADVTPAPADTDPPVPAFVPANGLTDILVWTKPTITFNEPVRKTDGNPITDGDLSSLITLKKTNASGAAVPFTATIDATKKIITLTPSVNLDNSQLYYLSVGPVEDASGNEAITGSATFTTISSTTAAITLTYPVGGEKMYAGQAQTITWNSANVTNAFIEVWVLDGSTRVWAWIPFVPTTPAAPGKVDITVPADALYGTEYKIRISDKDNPAVNSMGGTFTIIAVATSISDLRQKCIPNDIVKLSSEATVTFLRQLNRNQKYIQDAGAGLLIDDASLVLTTTIAQGDNIKNLEGKLGLYGNALQLVPTMPSVTVVSSGNSVTIPEMTLAEYAANYLQYESMLIKIKSFRFTAGNGTATFAASTTYDMTEGASTISFRTFLSGEGNIVGSVIPNLKIGSVLIGGFYNTTIQAYGRSTGDFIALSSSKAITSFSFTTPATTGTIDETGKTVSLAVPSATIVTALVPTVAVSPKATISPASGTAQDFTSPVNYTVTAEDGTTQVYVVSVSFLTGIEKGTDRNMVLYPVPAASILNVKNIGSVTTIEILDVTGKIVIRMDDVNQNEVKIPVSNLRKGMYFIKLTTPEGKVIRRFIKS
jgi:hypothetical protein